MSDEQFTSLGFPSPPIDMVDLERTDLDLFKKMRKLSALDFNLRAGGLVEYRTWYESKEVIDEMELWEVSLQ